MATNPTYYPGTVKNRDVVYLCDKTSRYAFEVMHSASSDMSFTNEFDTARMLAYLGDIDAAIAYIQAQPQLDLPESHPMDHPIEPFPEIRNMESDELDHILRLLQAIYIEAANCQSARAAAGLIGFDAGRLTAVVSKARNWITEYMAARQPMDLPESSPQQLPAPPGRHGV